MRTQLFCFFLAMLLSSTGALGQALPDEEGTTSGAGGHTFVGSNARLSIGIDDDGDLLGEYFQTFADDSDSAWIGEAWVSDGAGGLKLNYHWLNQNVSNLDALDADALARARIYKLFAAVDQNDFDDRKATLGFGVEQADVFFSFYGMGAITDERLVNTNVDIFTDTIFGTDDGRDFTQLQTTTVTTRLFEQPYDYGLGARLGRYFEGGWRVQGGFDYEEGDGDADQTTASFHVEKFFTGTPHSLMLRTEFTEKDGRLEPDQTDSRIALLYRYDFGRTHRPAQLFERVQVEAPASAAGQDSAEFEQRMVEHEISVSEDVFFDFDKSTIRPEGSADLNEIARLLSDENAIGNIRIVGHTCNIGTEQYNQGLSERRAQAVKDYLVARGIDADRLNCEGQGELNPKYSNATEESRRRNRRVDIGFVTTELTAERIRKDAAPELVWETREVKRIPAWISRGLRNPVVHKRSVDVYRTQEVDTQVALGDREFINRAPNAVDDMFALDENSMGTSLDVLANDSDPDGDSLNIVSVSGASNGTVVNNGNSLTYTPDADFFGSDSFTYTIADDDGLTDTATVTITVNAVNEAPNASDDTATTEAGMPVPIDVLANDSDPDGDTLNVGSLGQPANGSVSTDGMIVTYTPDDGFFGTDNFTYTVVDGNGGTDTATVTVTVEEPEPANSPPVAVDDDVSIFKNNTGIFDLLANDSDPDGDPISIVSITQPDKGTATIMGDGTVLYEPMLLWFGFDSFTYTIADSEGNTDTATVNITVLSSGS